jgi:hypothetical protein
MRAEGHKELQGVLEATLGRLEASISATRGHEARVAQLLKQVLCFELACSQGPCMGRDAACMGSGAACKEGTGVRWAHAARQVEELTQQRDALLRMWEVHSKAFPEQDAAEAAAE